MKLRCARRACVCLLAVVAATSCAGCAQQNLRIGWEDDDTGKIDARDAGADRASGMDAGPTHTVDAAASPTCIVDPQHGNSGTCAASRNHVSLEDLSADPSGAPTYYAGGSNLPPGDYQVEYIDGCTQWTGTWTVAGIAGYFVVDDQGQSYAPAPALLGVGLGSGVFATRDECVAANRELCPAEFAFPGGRLALSAMGGIRIDLRDSSSDSQSPTYRLTRCE